MQSVPFRSLPEGKEKVIQQLIADDPSILGLGPLFLRAKERSQPSGGRIDLLLQDESGTSWYEVEVQLGETDPSHIIRTIEYWDRERRRYPDVHHTAVLVAEEINGRFFNVISLFNQSIPIVALKFTTLKQGEQFGILFTQILGYEPRGLEREDEILSKADRSYWEQRSSQFAMKAADKIVQFCKDKIDKSIELKYNKPYVGTTLQGRVSNFVTFIPQKKALRITIHCKQTVEFDKALDDSGLDSSFEGGAYPGYRVRLGENEVSEAESLVQTLVLAAFQDCEGSQALASIGDS